MKLSSVAVLGAAVVIGSLLIASISTTLRVNLSNVASLRTAVERATPVEQCQASPTPQRAVVAPAPGGVWGAGWNAVAWDAWLAGDCQAAANAWAQQTQIAPDPMAWYWLGIARASRSKTEEAVAAFQRAGAYPRLLALARVARSRDDHAAALAWFDLAWRVQPDLEAVRPTAAAHVRLGQPQEAIAVWREWADALPQSSADHWRARGEAAQLEDDLEEAARLYTHGALLANADLNLARKARAAMERIQNLDGALQMALREVELAPTLPGPYLDVAKVYLQREDFGAALDWARRGRQVAPGDWRPRRLMGTIACRRGDYHSAMVHLAEAGLLAPDGLAVELSRAQCYHEAGEVRSAIAELERLLSQREGATPEVGTAYVLLGDWRAELGLLEQAELAYRQALRSRPDDAGIHARLERLAEQRDTAR